MTTSTSLSNKASDHNHVGDISACPVFRMLPEGLQVQARQQQHLWDYLHTVSLEKFGVPEYHETLSRSMGDKKHPNVIYPIAGDIYIHIYPNKADARHYYVAIEPGMSEDVTDILHEAELRLVDYVSDLDTADDSEGREGALLRCLSKFCQVRDRPLNGNGASRGGPSGLTPTSWSWTSPS